MHKLYIQKYPTNPNCHRISHIPNFVYCLSTMAVAVGWATVSPHAKPNIHLELTICKWVGGNMVISICTGNRNALGGTLSKYKWFYSHMHTSCRSDAALQYSRIFSLFSWLLKYVHKKRIHTHTHSFIVPLWRGQWYVWLWKSRSCPAHTHTHKCTHTQTVI